MRFSSGVVINSFLHFNLKATLVNSNQILYILFKIVFMRFGKIFMPQVNIALDDLLVYGTFLYKMCQSEIVFFCIQIVNRHSQLVISCFSI